MLPTDLNTIVSEVSGRFLVPGMAPETGAFPITIRGVCVNSKMALPHTLFIALRGRRTDGHHFVSEAFRNGAAAAVVSEAAAAMIEDLQRPLIAVPDPLRALQSLARWHRRQALGDVVAVTGSNGKTVVKDALAAILGRRSLFASPGSFNSQLGLPLAVLGVDNYRPLAILEVGVSQPGEMAVLEDIARPSYGILTNIGVAHLASFGSRMAIAREKITLFHHIPKQGWLLVPAGEPVVEEAIAEFACRVYRFGSSDQPLALVSLSLADDGRILELSTSSGGSQKVRVATRSQHIISDLHIAATAAHLLGATLDEIASALDGYAPPPTRMEFWSSTEGIRIINDAYSADPISVQAALSSAALATTRTGKLVFAFAGMRELGTEAVREHRQVGAHAAECGFSHVALVGNGNLVHTAAGYHAAKPDGNVVTVATPDDLNAYLRQTLQFGDTILFKGHRDSGMGRAAQMLAGSVAQRCLWVDMGAIMENVARFRRHCRGGTRILAMLKALAYGTEVVRLASWLSNLGISHIGVSSTDEGVQIRKAGVSQEIYVFLPFLDGIDDLLRYRLTPIIYSPEMAASFISAMAGSGHSLDVHLKVNTGMNRLGVEPDVAVAVADRIRKSGTLNLKGVCTHFAAADNPELDDFTRSQISVFDETVARLRNAGFNDLIVHAANTAATIRFPEAHYDMVRIGIGLYGIHSSPVTRKLLDLELAVGVTSRIVSIRDLPAGAYVGYNCNHMTERASRIGIVPFGYDDGIPRQLSGLGTALVEGHPAPILGRINMDQTMIDLTGLNGIEVGAEVLLYGTHNGRTLSPEDVSNCAGTIPHELLIRLGKRVHRIFIEP
jgi:alanine racemase